ncbi:hypothetical protein DH2020_036272 [Rehmannia glutinosa]|uniref:Uncharacterized protein n=1 Tax=Rehmannia glutinosa TaxID=99300 RepID=A0ABR0V6D7_REHGL
MEAFSLLKYWHTGAGTGRGTITLFTGDSTFFPRAATKTTVTPASPSSGDDEDGPYFDLEFTISDDDTSEKSKSGGEEFPKIDDSNVTLSPNSDDELFINGDLFPIEPSSTISNGKSVENPNGALEKTEKSEKNEDFDDDKMFTVYKFEFGEFKGPLVSLFARDNTSNLANHGRFSKDSDEKKLIQKYLKMLKPLYIRVSGSYVEKMKFSGGVGFPGGGGAVSPPCTAVASNGKNLQGNNNINLQAGLKVVHGESVMLSRSVSDPSVIMPTVSSPSTSLYSSGEAKETKLNLGF